MISGKIIHLTEKGFGFIQSDEYPENLFFHARELKNGRIEELQNGDAVEFEEAIQGEKGMAARKITIL